MDRSSQYRTHILLYIIMPLSLSGMNLLLAAVNLYFGHTFSLVMSIGAAIWLAHKTISDTGNGRFAEAEALQLEIDSYKEKKKLF